MTTFQSSLVVLALTACQQLIIRYETIWVATLSAISWVNVQRWYLTKSDYVCYLSLPPLFATPGSIRDTNRVSVCNMKSFNTPIDVVWYNLLICGVKTARVIIHQNPIWWSRCIWQYANCIQARSAVITYVGIFDSEIAFWKLRPRCYYSRFHLNWLTLVLETLSHPMAVIDH